LSDAIIVNEGRQTFSRLLHLCSTIEPEQLQIPCGRRRLAAGAANSLGRSSKAKATNPKPLFLMQHFNRLHMPLSKIIILTLEQWLS
jgi:hypothetical protein